MDMPNSVVSNDAPNRKAFLLTIAIFVLPVIVAYTLLKTGWYTSAGTTNHGLLIDPPIPFDNLTLYDDSHQTLPVDQFRKKWWIMYVMPSHCDAACKNSLYLMRQSHQALGPEQSRVAELIILPQQIDAALSQWLQTEFPHATKASADAAALDSTLAAAMHDHQQPSEAGHLFLVDTMGAIFMHYPGYTNEQESILKGRDLLKDLQKVLKLSKIG